MPDFYYHGIKVEDLGETLRRPNMRWRTVVNGIELRGRSMKDIRNQINYELSGRFDHARILRYMAMQKFEESIAYQKKANGLSR